MTILQRSIIAILILLPLVAGGYLLVSGSSETTETLETEQPSKINEITNVKADPHSSKTQMQMLIAKLEQKMATNELNLEDTMLLGRSYMMNGDFAKAVTALDKANNLEANSLDILIPLADSIAQSQKGQYTGRSYEVLQQAKGIDPKNPMVLWLLARGEYQLGNKEQSVTYLTQLYNMLEPGSKNQQNVGMQLAQMGHAPEGFKPPTAEQPSASAGVAIKVTLEISPEMKEKLKGTTAFIYAKSQTGMPMPIAAKKMPSEELTTTITITQADELLPNRKLIDIAKIKVGIKISDNASVDSGNTLFRTEQNLPDSKAVNLVVKF
ncbi:MAG: cytochrome c-type biogenesis protein CcmH [Thiomicrorhabdus sp.]|nr:MAG: cytochrome c-type biogenesis protein CcmH [Thiomicrorhabdus sp.]